MYLLNCRGFDLKTSRILQELFTQSFLFARVISLAISINAAPCMNELLKEEKTCGMEEGEKKKIKKEQNRKKKKKGKKEKGGRKTEKEEKEINLISL